MLSLLVRMHECEGCRSRGKDLVILRVTRTEQEEFKVKVMAQQG